MKPEHLISSVYAQFDGDCMMEGISHEDELGMWMKTAKRDAKAVVDAGLPMTIAKKKGGRK